MASRPKAQHFVPRFYLANFVDEKGLVWTYDPKEEVVRGGAPEKTAIETNFYSVVDQEGNYIDEIEKWLSGVEGKAADLYPKVLRGELLQGQEKADFAVFVSSLFARSPSQINFAAETMGALAQMLNDKIVADRGRFEKFMDKFEAEAGREPTTPKQRDDVFNFARDKSKYTVSVDRKAGLRGMSVADPLTKIFLEMKWIVLESKQQHIITSDSPVVRITPRQYHSPVYGDGGFMNKYAFVTLPLTPTKVLELYWGKSERAGVYPVDKQRARMFNKQRAGFCHRYLYSSQVDSGIMALGKRHIGPAMKIDFGRELAPIEVKRRL